MIGWSLHRKDCQRKRKLYRDRLTCWIRIWQIKSNSFLMSGKNRYLYFISSSIFVMFDMMKKYWFCVIVDFFFKTNVNACFVLNEDIFYSKSARNLDLQSRLEEQTDENEHLQNTLEALRKTNAEQTKKIDQYIEKLHDVRIPKL